MEALIKVWLCDDVVGVISWSRFGKSQKLAAGVENTDWSNAVIDDDTLGNESNVFKEKSDSSTFEVVLLMKLLKHHQHKDPESLRFCRSMPKYARSPSRELP